MELIYPDYYHKFHCLAGACPDSCCKDWAVVIDEDSAQRYRTLSGELGDALRNALTREDDDLILQLRPDGRCPMWRDDGLCRIHAQQGEDWLCDTCRDFPRLRHDYGSFVELGLELSCPEAAQLILSADRYRTKQELLPGGDDSDYDEEAMDILLRSREVILTFLNETSMSVGDALAVMLLYSYDVQAELDGGDPAQLHPESALSAARSIAQPSSTKALLDYHKGLEILTPQWRKLLDAPCPVPWSREHLAMARYFVARYWLQAVSDWDLVSRVKLCLCACLTVKYVGGDISRTAQLYSKEIENDAENTCAILDAAFSSPALADVYLLGLLLKEEM